MFKLFAWLIKGSLVFPSASWKKAIDYLWGKSNDMAKADFSCSIYSNHDLLGTVNVIKP